MSRQEWPAQKVREWLLALLRFAVTLDQADLATVQAIAIEMDRLGSHLDTATFAFLARSSAEFCHAIANKDDPNSIALLHRQLARIEIVVCGGRSKPCSIVSNAPHGGQASATTASFGKG